MVFKMFMFYQSFKALLTRFCNWKFLYLFDNISYKIGKSRKINKVIWYIINTRLFKIWVNSLKSSESNGSSNIYTNFNFLFWLVLGLICIKFQFLDHLYMKKLWKWILNFRALKILRPAVADFINSHPVMEYVSYKFKENYYLLIQIAWKFSTTIPLIYGKIRMFSIFHYNAHESVILA